MDYVYSSIVFFAKGGNLDGTVFEVGPFLDWSALTPNENERICSEYGDYAIPFYKCTFSILGLRLPFTTFETNVLKHLVLALSQLYPGSYAHVKIYQYWCE